MITIEETKNRVQQLIISEISKMVDDGYTDTQIVSNFQIRGAETSDVMAVIARVKSSRNKSTNVNHGNSNSTTDLTARVSELKPVVRTVDISDVFNNTLLTSKTLEQIPSIDKTNQISTSDTVTTVSVPPLVQSEYQNVVPVAAYPVPLNLTYPTKLNILNRQVQVTLIKKKPDIIVLDNVLTAEECQQIIDIARPKIKPSDVVDRDSGNNISHDARTSTGAFFGKGETPLLRWIEQFCAEFLKWPYEKSEGFQVLNYQVGQQYLAHYDHFDPETNSGREVEASKAGNRNATILFYLNDVAEGGGTQFPKLDLTVMPKMGRMLYFGYPDITKALDTLHAGMPPTQGEKWVAVNWYRQGNYS